MKLLLFCSLSLYVDIFRTNILFLKKGFIYFWREGKGGRKGEKHQCVVTSCALPTRDLAITQACALTGN